jgi:hypothetical protein
MARSTKGVIVMDETWMAKEHTFYLECREVCTLVWHSDGHEVTMPEAVRLARAKWGSMPETTIRNRLYKMHGEVFDGVAMFIVHRQFGRVLCRVENMKDIL